jgi:hypothetical protein
MNTRGISSGITRLMGLMVLFAGLAAGLGAQQPQVLPGTTGASSDATQPAGRTKDVAGGIQGQGEALVWHLELVNDLRVRAQIQKRLDELKPQIQAAMPQSGGVLIAAYVDDTRFEDIGSVRELRSVKIIGPYASEKDANADLKIPKLQPGTQATSPSGRAGDLVKTKPQYFWMAAPVTIPSLAKPDELGKAEKSLAALVTSVRNTIEAETTRLDIEWSAIEKENARLNKARRFSAPKTDAAKKMQDDGKREFDAWEATQRAGIKAERDAAAVAHTTAEQERSSLAAMANERCPAGKTYDECQVHYDWKNDYLKRKTAHQALIGQEVSQEARLAAAAVRLETRFPAMRDARLRDLDMRVKAAEKGQEAADELAKAQSEFTERLNRFNKEDDAVHKIRQLLKDVEQVTDRLNPARK